jgi:uncharacterized membrane protein YvbJ
MINKLKATILSLSILFVLAVPAAAFAAVDCSKQEAQANIECSLKCGSNLSLNSVSSDPATKQCDNTTAGTGKTNFTDIAKKIINILSVLVGAVAVIMIIFGGFRYVTSAGNDSNVSAAKNTILYAIVGLIIVALAQVVVHFVLNNLTG